PLGVSFNITSDGVNPIEIEYTLTSGGGAVNEAFFVINGFQIEGQRAAVSSSRATATLMILDDDTDQPRYDFTTANYADLEGNITETTNVVMLRRSGNIGIASSVDVVLAPGPGDPAGEDVDYTRGPVTVTFAPGETLKPVPIELLGDLLVETDETVFLSLTNFRAEAPADPIGFLLVQEGPVAANAGDAAPVNLATGRPAFALDVIAAGTHSIAGANDGVYGNNSSWISGGNTGTEGAFIGVNLGASPVSDVQSIAFGRSNVLAGDPCGGGVCTDRDTGVFTIQYTQVPNPGTALVTTGDESTGWVTIAAVDYDTLVDPLFTQPHQRHRYDFDPVDATGMRILVSAANSAIDEIEIYNEPGRNGGPVVPGPTIGGGGAIGRVPEAADYTLLYELPIPDNGNFNATAVPYSVNNAAALAGVDFSRVGYYMELDNGGGLEWVFVTMDAFTSDVFALDIPNNPNPSVWQQTVDNMDVFASAGAGVTTGTGIATGNIEMWPSNYSQGNAANVPGASGSAYDFGDAGAGTGSGHGSFQVHNYGAGETIFAYNRWGNSGGPDELGIGNAPGANTDWTFAANAATYTVKNLQIFILAQPAGQAEEVLAEYTFNGSTLASSDTNAETTASDFAPGAGFDDGGSPTSFGFSTGGNPAPGRYVRYRALTDNLAGAIADNDHYSFTIAPEAGEALNLTNLTFDFNADQQTTYAVFSSHTGFGAGSEIATFSRAGGFVNQSIDLSGGAFAGIGGPIEFRIVVFDAGDNTDAATRIDNIRVLGFTSELIASGGAGVTNPTAILTIQNDDDVVFNFVQDDFRVDELDVTHTTNAVTVERSGDTTIAASVDVVLSPGTATPGDDYTPAVITLNFAPGETIKTVPIEILGDVFAELDETVHLSFTNFQSMISVPRPYTADANTLHLYHFDEAAGTGFVQDVGSGATLDLNVVTSPAVQAADGYGPFGRSLGLGAAANNGFAGNMADTAGTNWQNPTTGAFTYEALIQTSSINTGDQQQIFARTDPTQIVQFRIENGQLQLVKADPTVETHGVPIPTTGEHAFLPGEWFHVAVTYNGDAGVDDNLKFYWTRVSAADGLANEIGSLNLSSDLANTATQTVVGNRIGGSGENVRGAIDEVRISDIARAPGDFLFSSAIGGGIAGDTQPQATLTIVNDDLITYEFTNSDFEVVEDDVVHTTGVVTIRRAGDTTIASSVDVVLTQTGATPATLGIDLENGPITVNFAPGELVKSVPITILGDILGEPDETVALGFTNFRAQFNANAPLVSYLGFDSAPQGVETLDALMTNNGTVNGATWMNEGGARGGVFSFDGTNDEIVLTGYQGITGRDPRTVTAWVQTTAQNNAIVAWGNNANAQKFVFRLNDNAGNGQVGALRLEVNGGFIIGTTDLRDGQWHHVAVTWENDGSPNVVDALLYVDGQLETVSGQQGNNLNTAANADVRIGNDPLTGGRNWNGKLDDVAIFGAALSQAEIQAIMSGDFTAYGVNVPLGEAAGQDTATLTILDDDAIFYEYSTDSFEVVEDDVPHTTNVVTITRSGNTRVASSVDVVLLPGAVDPATPNVDYTAATITVRFEVGETQASVPIEILGDLILEADETIELGLGNFRVFPAPSAVIGQATLATDTPGSTAGDGGAANLLFLQTDYVAPADGFISNFTLRNDSDTAAERVDLLVLRPTGGDNYDVVHRVTIGTEDNDAATSGVRTYDIGNLPVQAGDVLGHWAPQSGGAVPFSNGGVAGWRTFADGALDVGDSINYAPPGNGPRTYFYSVEFAGLPIFGGAAGAQDTATLTILDDDLIEYEFIQDNFETPEGDVPNVTNVVTVRRSGKTTIASSVDVVLTPGSVNPATPNVDYNASVLTVSFAPGETEKTVPIEILGELLSELDETVNLGFTNFRVGFADQVRNDAAIAFYQFDEAAGATIADSSAAGASHPGTIQGGVNLGVASVNAQLGTAADFVGGNVRIGDHGDFAIGTGDFAVEMWFNADTTARGDLFTGKGNGNDFGIHSSSQGPASVTQYFNGFNGQANTIAINTWHHLVVTREAGVMRTIIDGVERVSAAEGDNWTFLNDLVIGSNHSGDPANITIPFDGQLDEVAIYDHALTVAQAATHYQRVIAGPLVLGRAGAQSSATLTILDDDTIRYDFEMPSFAEDEGDVPHITNAITILRSGKTNVTSMVDVIVAPSGTNPATADDDFTAGPITVTFLPGETSKTLPLEVLGDEFIEPDETVTLSFTNFRAVSVEASVPPAHRYDFNGGAFADTGTTGGIDMTIVGGGSIDPAVVASVTDANGVTRNNVVQQFASGAAINDPDSFLEGASPGFGASDPWTISMWVNVEDINRSGAAGQFQSIFANGASGGRFQVNANQGRLAVQHAGGTTAGPAMQSNVWHHVALVRTGSGANNAVMYVDGVASAPFSLADGDMAWTGFRLANRGGNEAVPGYYDDVRLYDVALNPTDVGLLAGQVITSGEPGQVQPNATFTILNDDTLNFRQIDEGGLIGDPPRVGPSPLILGQPNIALQMMGGVAFSQDHLANIGGRVFSAPNVNDNLYSVPQQVVQEPWIANTNGTSFVGVRFNAAYTIDKIAFQSQFANRTNGTYEFQFTRDSFAGVNLAEPATDVSAMAWHTIGELTITDGQPDLRRLFEFDAIGGVTGVRVIVQSTDAPIAIAELEVYASPVPTYDFTVSDFSTPEGDTVDVGGVVEDFNYPNGSVDGLGGAAGIWTGPWATAGTNPDNHFAISGGRLRAIPAGGATASIQRPFDLGLDPNRTIYFAYDFELNANTEGQYETLLQFHGGNVQFGVRDDDFFINLAGATDTFSPGAAFTGNFRLVGRLTFNASGADDELVMWIDPVAETDAPALSVTADLGQSDLGSLLEFAKVNQDQVEMFFDNLAFGTNFDFTSASRVVTINRVGITDLASSVDVVLVPVGSDPATLGDDVIAGPITINFAPGETQQVVPIEILGDLFIEADETLELQLTNFQVTQPLLLQYGFDAAPQGGITPDSAADNDGAVNGPTWMNVGGARGGVMSFDGVNDEILATNFHGVTGTAPRTVAAWINTTNTGNHVIASWGLNNAGEKFVFRVTDQGGPAGSLRVEINGGSVVSNGIVADGQWHHVAAVFPEDANPNANDVELYIDGVLQGLASIAGRALDTADGVDLHIGSDAFGNRFFDGLMDDVVMLDTALSPAQVAQLMRGNLAGLNFPKQGQAGLSNPTATLTILNDDTVTYDFARRVYRTTEGDVPNFANVVEITRTGDLSIFSTVDLVLSPGPIDPATPDVDYTSTTIPVTFAPGESSQIVPIEILGELFVELDETISLSLANPRRANVFLLHDEFDDVPGNLSINNNGVGSGYTVDSVGGFVTEANGFATLSAGSNLTSMFSDETVDVARNEIVTATWDIGGGSGGLNDQRVYVGLRSTTASFALPGAGFEAPGFWVTIADRDNFGGNGANGNLIHVASDNTVTTLASWNWMTYDKDVNTDLTINLDLSSSGYELRLSEAVDMVAGTLRATFADAGVVNNLTSAHAFAYQQLGGGTLAIDRISVTEAPTPLGEIATGPVAGPVIAAAGGDVDAGGAWRTRSDSKPLDIDGDRVYGSDGYYVDYSAGTGIQQSLPGYVSSINQVAGLLIFEAGQNTGPNYLSLDLASETPSDDVADQVSGLLYTQPGVGASDWLEFTLSEDATFRLGVIIDHSDRAGITPSDLTLTQIAGGTASATQVTAAPNLNIDYYFFDVQGSAGDAFRVSGFNNAGHPANGIAGIFFDSLEAFALSPGEAILVIENDDTAPEYDFALASYEVEEGDDTHTVNVVEITRSGNLTFASAVDVILGPAAVAPATPGVDFTPGPITITFAPGETTKAIPIEILGDTMNESDETIAISLANFRIFPDGVPAAVPTSLETYFSFNQAPVGGTVADEAGANDADVNGATFVDLGGARGGALRFDGGDVVSVPYSASLNTQSFTASAWVRATGGASSFRSAFTSRDSIGTFQGYILYAGADNNWQFWTGAGGGWDVLTGPAVTSSLVHIAVSFDATTGTKSMYVNGTLFNSVTDQQYAPMTNTNNPLSIGRGGDTGGQFGFIGDIDDFAFFNAALSDAEIGEIFNGALSQTGSTLPIGVAGQTQPTSELTLLNDDGITFDFTIDSYEVLEGDVPNLIDVVTVTRSGDPSLPASVDVMLGAVGTTLDLADIVGGGNGTGTGAFQNAINPRDGSFSNSGTNPLNAHVAGPNQYNTPEAAANPSGYVDGVFTPWGGGASVQLDSTGNAFDTFDDAAHSPYGNIVNGPQGGHPALLQGENYAGAGHSMIMGIGSTGVTFDLNAIEADNPGLEVSSFSSRAGLNDQAGTENGDVTFYVFVDGQLEFRQSVTGRNAFTDINLPIPSGGRFLTLVITDQGDNAGFDRAFWGDPTIGLSVPSISATPGEDFAPGMIRVDFAPGETEKVVPIEILG
ncbi:MAG: NPCBM/NEW2 domain-containing protein, partial [Planctomycetales bacterium]|nr:NPCBM/NEW2 domain-containing protein [Planctomycetales bacterium]